MLTKWGLEQGDGFVYRGDLYRSAALLLNNAFIGLTPLAWSPTRST